MTHHVRFTTQLQGTMRFWGSTKKATIEKIGQMSQLLLSVFQKDSCKVAEMDVASQ